MISIILSALLAGVIVYGFWNGEVLTDAQAYILFIVLVTNFEVASLHRKVNHLLKGK